MNIITTNWIRMVSVSVFSVSFMLGMALATWHEVAEVTGDTALATIIAIIYTGQAVSVVSTGLAAVIEGGAYIVVIAHRMVQQGIERGKEEGRAEGRAEGRQEGIVEGIAIGHDTGRVEGRTEGRTEGRAEGRAEAYEDVDKQLDAYFKRMDEAREKGEDFNEPRPKFSRNGR